MCICYYVWVLFVWMLRHGQLFVTPWTVVRKPPLSMEFSRQEYWSGLHFPPPVDLPDPGIEPWSLACPALAGGFFTTEPPGKRHLRQYMDFIYLKRLCKCYWVSWDGEIILDYSGGSSVIVVVAVQSPSYVQIFATPWIVALKTSLSLTISWNLLKFMSSAWVMPSIYILKSRELFLAVVRKRVVIMEEFPEKCNFLAFMEEGGQELRHAGGLQKNQGSKFSFVASREEHSSANTCVSPVRSYQAPNLQNCKIINLYGSQLPLCETATLLL